jgi:hypothetical protein
VKLNISQRLPRGCNIFVYYFLPLRAFASAALLIFLFKGEAAAARVRLLFFARGSGNSKRAYLIFIWPFADLSILCKYFF